MRQDRAEQRKSALNKTGLVEFIKTVAFALAFAVIIRTAAFANFYIPSSSMVPNLLVGDQLFVSKFSYGYSRFSLPFGLHLFDGRILASKPERGDVVVFKWPGDSDTNYIKRLIGLPGDTIEMRDETLYINGAAVPRVIVPGARHYDTELGSHVQTYIETLPGGKSHTIQLADQPRNENFPRCEGQQARCAYTVPAGMYFMMGDNRDNSADSRVPVNQGGVGPLPAVNLIGRAEIIYFSSNGEAELWEPWKWPVAVRYARLLDVVQ